MRVTLVLAAALLTIGSTQLQADDDSVLFSDDFSTFDPAWGNPAPQQSVKGGKFIIQPTINTTYTTLYQGNLFGDADVTVKVTETDGGTDEGGGIAFWGADSDNFYVAELQPDGQAGVARYVKDQWATPVYFAVRDSVTKGVGQVNELRVVTTGNLATVYINGKQLVAFRGNPPTGGSQIGLHGESSAKGVYTWQFSDFVIRKPTAAQLAATPQSTAPADPSVLFAADFSTNDPAWGAPDDQDYVEGGKYILKPAANRANTALYSGNLFGDVDLRANVCLASGATDGPAGIVFWAADTENYYVAEFQGDGNVSIARQIQGKWLNPVEFSVQPAVKQGVGQVNALRVVTKGKSGTLYINDKQVYTFKGFPPDGLSRIGVHGESGGQNCVWQFSDLVVRTPQ